MIDDYFGVNQFALDEKMHRSHHQQGDNLVNETCNSINRSVNNSGQPLKVNVDLQEVVLIGALLFAKFCLWFLYRAAQKYELDVTGL